MSEAVVIIGTSSRDADLLYRSGFHVEDPVLLIDYLGKQYLFLNDLELDRGRAEATVSEVVPLTQYLHLIDRSKPLLPQVAHLFLKETDVDTVAVGGMFPSDGYAYLQGRGYHMAIKSLPLYQERLIKNEGEKNKIRSMMKAVDDAMSVVVKTLADATIADGNIISNGKPLRSEDIKLLINQTLLKHQSICNSVIVAGGIQGVDPHNQGTGIIPANQPIVMDIFPQSFVHGYWGDQTRTLLKGKATPEQKRQYETVLKGQQIGIDRLISGVNGADIHDEINRYFESCGYQTGVLDGRMQGFFHGTGHGVGLELHEAPRISSNMNNILKTGHVVTVEPGLYYAATGGVRIEDTLFVTDNGAENLTYSPKFFEIE